MGKMKPDPFEDAVRILLEGDAPRVWSLIVTIFGDLAQTQAGALSGPLLAGILTPLGIKPEAMRVALHRLRNEGWIETEKRGREALHRLSARGLEESRAASGRIYSNAHPAQEDWHMICLEQLVSPQEQSRAAALGARGYVPIAPGVYLANAPAQASPAGALVIEGRLGEVPAWISASVASPAVRSAFKDLSAALELVDWPLLAQSALGAERTAALRALVVHRWRKLVLRLPPVPDIIFGTDFEGFACRAHVLAALKALPRPELSAL